MAQRIKTSFDLRIEERAFDTLREDFNNVLTRTLYNMERKGNEESQITLKMKIAFSRLVIDGREMIVPKIEHKISSTIQTKDKESGKLNGEYELSFSPALGKYILDPIGGDQLGFFG